MHEFMLDLETAATSNKAAILSIGLVKFDIDTGEILNEFYQNVDLQSCIDFDFEINADTLYWWFGQEKEAGLALTNDKIHITHALQRVADFVEHFDGPRNLWGNGVRFHYQILHNAFKRCRVNWPFSYRDDMDVRTLVKIGKALGVSQGNTKREGTHHNALDDCKYQVKYVSSIWKALNEDKSGLQQIKDAAC